MITHHDTISVPDLPIHELQLREDVIGLCDRGSAQVWHLSPTRSHFTIGNHRDCEVRIQSPYVSDKHCVLERVGHNRLIIRDLDSKNGVFLGRTRVSVADISVGSHITIGGIHLRAFGAQDATCAQVEREMVGESEKFRRAVDYTKRVAATGGACNIIILGETGTGKELFAKLIHQVSPRKHNPFVAINCGGLTANLIGSELFGHVRGAFTDAIGDHPGLFVQADSGTLFLDEIGELPLNQQPHLLRALETGEVRPLGGTSVQTVDVRIVAATNRVDLLSSGTIRADLYHRLATVVIELPPLRERVSDIPLLVNEFLKRKQAVRLVHPKTFEKLQRYDWPGNIRELGHAVDRALALCGDELTIEALLPQIFEADPYQTRKALSARISANRPPQEPRNAIDDGVRNIISAAFVRYGSLRRTAAALGIPKSTLADRAARYGVRARRSR